MKDIFVRKYWDEQDIMFYLHFKDGRAVKQIEVTFEKKVFLSLKNPQNDDSILYDQSLDELDLDGSDFITEDEFIEIWNQREPMSNIF